MYYFILHRCRSANLGYLGLRIQILLWFSLMAQLMAAGVLAAPTAVKGVMKQCRYVLLHQLHLPFCGAPYVKRTGFSSERASAIPVMRWRGTSSRETIQRGRR